MNNKIKENDIVYKLVNPEIVSCGYITAKVIKENNKLVAIDITNKNYKYDVIAWNDSLKKSIKDLGKILTIDDIECPCCKRPYE